MRCIYCVNLLALGWLAGSSPAQQPLVSGPAAGQRPGPYASLVCTGEKRGQLHCFVCEAADRPAVIVFARLSEPLGKLTKRLDEALAANKGAELRAWVTFLAKTHVDLDDKVVQWGRGHGVSTVPLMVFEETGGPPAYRLAGDADVTVLLSVKQKVVESFSFRDGELNEKGINAVLEAVPLIVEKK